MFDIFKILWFVPVPNWLHSKLRILIWYSFSLSAIDVMWVTTVSVGYDMGRYSRHVFKVEYFDDFCWYFVKLMEHQCPSVWGEYGEGFFTSLIACIGLWIIVIYSIYYTGAQYELIGNENESKTELMNINENSSVPLLFGGDEEQELLL